MTALDTDRRSARRYCSVDHHGIASARIRPGMAASLLNMSAGGTLIETGHRLLPGSRVEICFDTRDGPAVVRGHVLRCSVVRLDGSSVRYRGAVEFDRRMPWLEGNEDNG
jgi:hypothetical protein